MWILYQVFYLITFVNVLLCTSATTNRYLFNKKKTNAEFVEMVRRKPTSQEKRALITTRT